MSSTFAMALWKASSTPEIDSMDRKKSAIPCPEKSFIMTDATYKYALAIKDGNLRFVYLPTDENKMGACWVWHCVENNGWLCFRNAVSGTYLGVRSGFGILRDGIQEPAWFLSAFDSNDLDKNRFCLRHSSDGKGYVMQVFHRKGPLKSQKESLVKIALKGYPEYGNLCIVEKEEPTVWGFIEV